MPYVPARRRINRWGFLPVGRGGADPILPPPQRARDKAAPHVPPPLERGGQGEGSAASVAVREPDIGAAAGDPSPNPSPKGRGIPSVPLSQRNLWGRGIRTAPLRRATLCALALLCGLSATTQAQAAAGTLLVLGDSLGAGFGLPAEQGFVPRLEAALRSRGHDIRVMNGSISGDTTAGGRARLGWTLSSKPDFVIVALGGNDGLRGLDPAETRANLRAILARLKERKIPVLLAGMKAPRNLGPEYEAAFNGAWPELARQYGAVLYPFFLDGVALDPALNQPDLIHPNAAGVAAIVERILPYVEKLIAR